MPNAIGLPAGTLVLTSNGYENIEDVKVGNLVLTHKCRWKKVTDIITGEAEVGTFQGNVKIQMTPEVNIYSAAESKHFPIGYDGKRKAKREASGVGTIRCADQMKDWFAATPRVIDDIIPDLMKIKLPKNPRSLLSTDFWCITGKYLLNRLRPEEVAQRTDIIQDAQNYTWWQHSTFGIGARTRTIPPYICTLPIEYRKAFLSGVMSANGTTADGLYRLHSSNKTMIYALRFLAESVGYYTNVAFTARAHQYIISGRVVNQSSRYTLSIFDDSARIRGIRSSDDNTVTWYRCSGFKMTDDVKTVYNLAVEEDNSFFADSIAVITNIF